MGAGGCRNAASVVMASGIVPGSECVSSAALFTGSICPTTRFTAQSKDVYVVVSLSEVSARMSFGILLRLRKKCIEVEACDLHQNNHHQHHHHYHHHHHHHGDLYSALTTISTKRFTLARYKYNY